MALYTQYLLLYQISTIKQPDVPYAAVIGALIQRRSVRSCCQALLLLSFFFPFPLAHFGVVPLKRVAMIQVARKMEPRT